MVSVETVGDELLVVRRRVLAWSGMSDLAALVALADWNALIPRLAGMSDDECRELAPRLAHIAYDVREVPIAWVEQALAGSPPAALQLCRGLRLTARRFDEADDDEDRDGSSLERLLRSPWLAGLTELTLGMDARGLTSSWLAGLHELRTLGVETTEPFTSALRDEQLTAIAAVPLGKLTLLSLDRVHVRGPGVAAVARSSTLSALTELELYAPATAALCAALGPAPALRGVRRLALCADRFTSASASALARASDLLTGLRALEFRVDESGGFDWGEPFTGHQGARNTRRFATALARLLPALRDCEGVKVMYTPANQVVELVRADFDRLADPRVLRAALPARMAAA